VEAETSALAALAAFARQDVPILPIATGGAWGWDGRIGKIFNSTGVRVDEKGPLPDLGMISWTNRPGTLLLDSNVETNPNVQASERQFARELARRGATVRLGRIPHLPSVNGPDDFIAEKGDEALLAVLNSAAEWTRIVPEPRLLQRALPSC